MQTPDNSLPFLIKDIAVLELAEDLDLTVYTPICLPRAGVTEEGQLYIFIGLMGHKTRRGILGSDCTTLILMLRVLSEYP